MKKLITLFLSATLLVASLAGCGTTSTPSESAPGSSEALNKWPTKTLEIIVPDSTGTGTDMNARILAPYLEKELGCTVIVTNKSGGGSTLCSQALMDAKNDGSTMALIHSAFISTKIWGTVDYDYNDATMVANLFSDFSSMIAANTQSGITSFQDLIDRSKANPGSISTVCDIGSIIYLEIASLENAAGITMAKADAGGVSERIATVIGGHADTVLLGASSLESYIDAGELVPLVAVNGEKIEKYPDIPTSQEICGWSWPASPTAAFFAPNTDTAIVELMEKALENILQNPDYISEYEAANGGNFIDFKPHEEALTFWNEARDAQLEAYKAAGLGG